MYAETCLSSYSPPDLIMHNITPHIQMERRGEDGGFAKEWGGNPSKLDVTSVSQVPKSKFILDVCESLVGSGWAGL